MFISKGCLAFLSLSTIMDVYFYRLGIFFQSIFDVNSQVTWNTNYVGHETGNINGLTQEEGRWLIFCNNRVYDFRHFWMPLKFIIQTDPNSNWFCGKLRFSIWWSHFLMASGASCTKLFLPHLSEVKTFFIFVFTKSSLSQKT